MPRRRRGPLAVALAALAALAAAVLLLRGGGTPRWREGAVPLSSGGAPSAEGPAIPARASIPGPGGSVAAATRPAAPAHVPDPPPVAEPFGLRVAVVDAAGASVAGAAVEVYAGWTATLDRTRFARGPGGTLPSPACNAATDATGTAEPDVRGMAGGEDVLVRAVASAGVAFASATLRRGEVVSLRMALLPGVAVRGRVEMRDGAPVPGADVIAWFSLGDGTCAARARTDGAGRFVVEGIPREAFRGTVEIRAPAARGRWDASRELPPPGPPTEDIVLVSERTCRVRGRCVDARGDGAVEVWLNAGVGPGHSVAAGATDGTGAFDFEVPRGTWTIHSTSERYETLARPGVPCDGEAIDLGTLVLDDLRVCLVRGRCLDESGAGLAGVGVSTGVGPGHSAGFARTDADGRFEIRSRPGTWAVMVDGVAWWRDVVCTGDAVDLGSLRRPGRAR